MQPPCAASASLPRFDRCQPVAGTSSCPAATLYATTVSSSAVDSAASSSSSTFVVSSTATLSERTTEILEHLERQRVELSVKYTEYENNIAAGILPPGTDEYHGKKLKTSYNNYVQLKAMDMTVTNPLIDEWARSAYGNIVNELRAIDSKIKAELKRQQLAKIAASAPAKVFGPLRSNELPNTLPKETSSSVEDLIGIPLEFIYDHIVPYFSTLECAMCPRTTGIYGDAYILERDDCEPQYSCAEHILDITTDWRRTRILRARGNEKATLYKVHATLVIADRVIAIPQAPVRFGGFVTLLVTHVIMSCQFRSVRYVRITPERDSFTTNTFEVQLMNPNERSKWTVHKTVTRSTRGTSSGGLASIVKAVGTHCAACRTPTGVQAAALLPCSCCGHRAADVHPRPSAVKALSQIKHCAQMETSMSHLLERRIALAHDARQHHQPVPTLPQDHVLMIKMVNDRKNEGPNDDSGIVGDESDGGKSDQEDDEEDEEDHDDRTVFKFHDAVALTGDQLGRVRGEHENPRRLDHVPQSHRAPLAKLGVADRQPLVHEHDVGAETRHDREGQPHEHARRVGPHRHRQIVPQAAELGDLGRPPADLPPRESLDEPPDNDVLIPGRIPLDAEHRIDEAGNCPLANDPATCGLVDAGQRLQERRLAGAVVAHDAEPVTGRQRE